MPSGCARRAGRETRPNPQTRPKIHASFSGFQDVCTGYRTGGRFIRVTQIKQFAEKETRAERNHARVEHGTTTSEKRPESGRSIFHSAAFFPQPQSLLHVPSPVRLLLPPPLCHPRLGAPHSRSSLPCRQPPCLLATYHRASGGAACRSALIASVAPFPRGIVKSARGNGAL